MSTTTLAATAAMTDEELLKVYHDRTSAWEALGSRSLNKPMSRLSESQKNQVDGLRMTYRMANDLILAELDRRNGEAVLGEITLKSVKSEFFLVLHGALRRNPWIPEFVYGIPNDAA